jgi:predicted methyltransferase
MPSFMRVLASDPRPSAEDASSRRGRGARDDPRSDAPSNDDAACASEALYEQAMKSPRSIALSIAAPSFLALSCVCAGAASCVTSAPTPAEASPTSEPSAEVSPASAAPVEPIGHPIVDSPDRDPADRALDPGRKPAEFLDFLAIQPGMRIAELFAGGGYTTELLARAVGPTGKVYAQNSRFVLERFAEKPWSERLKKPVMQNVVRVDRELDDPLPPEAKDLDKVVYVLSYHDAVHLGADRSKMNKAVFDALKTGGTYVVVDHSGRPGTGVSEAKTLHRIEESVVVDEILAAGFVPSAQASFLRNPADTRDWNDAPTAAGERRGTSDRFILEFKKPERKKAVNSAK